MNPLKILSSLAKALQGGGDPRHVAAGFALGAVWGLVPKGNLFSVIFLLLFFFLQADKGVALVTALLFTSAGYLLDGLAHGVGLALLTAGGLKPLWAWLYNLPIVPLTKFNNTVVLGNLAIGLLLYLPLYQAGKRGAVHYRIHYAPAVARWPLVKALTSLRIVQFYRSLTSD
jgi:uncharacterized protein (TIGR03546 family)